MSNDPHEAGAAQHDNDSPERQCEFLFQLAGDEQRVVYVSSAPDDDYDDDFRLFVGVPPHLAAVPVREVIRFRDGGSVSVEIAQGGGLFAPAPLRNEPARWIVPNGNAEPQETELVPLEPDRYVITEDERQATIHPQ